MKRLLTAIIAIMLVLTLFAGCAPDNIKQPASDVAPDVAPEPMPDVTPVPDTNDDKAPVTNDDTKPAPFVLTDSSKKKNEGVLPSASVERLEFAELASIKDKTLNMFVTNESAFSAGKLSEQEWLAKLKDELSLTVEFNISSKATLYQKQLIAAKTGKDLDLITADVNDIAQALPLMSAKLGSFDLEETDLPFSANLFEITGGKAFTARGNARVLWYNKSIIKDDAPFELYKKGEWSNELLSAQLISAKNAKQALLETPSGLTAFLSTAGEQVTGIINKKLTVATKSDSAEKARETYGKLFEDASAINDREHSFARGNTAYIYSNTPSSTDYEVGFVPIPTCTEDGFAVSELCGTAIGVSKYIDKENVTAALTLAMLWSARYTESRVDTMLFDLKLGEQKTNVYFDICENEARLLTADAEISDIIGKKLKIKDEAYEKAKSRAELINERS